MKKLLAFILLALPAAGCANVTSGQPGMTPATGEAWYTKEVGIPGLVSFSSSIYYCPKDTPEKCTKAEIKKQ